MSKLKIHPICAEVPESSEEQYQQLLQSMREHGFDEDSPIIMHEGMILDGRHRYRAATELGIEAVWDDWKPCSPTDTPDSFILRSNIRRDLTPAQRAAWMATRMERIKQEAQARMTTGTGDPPAVTAGGSRHEREASTIAAKQANVGREAIQVAEKARDEAPEVLEAMRKGEVTVAEAKRQLNRRPPPPPDPEPVASDAPAPARQAPPPPEPEYLDGVNKPIPPEMLDVFKESSKYPELLSAIAKLLKDARSIASTPLGTFLRIDLFETHIKNARSVINCAVPYAVCPYRPCDKGCKCCRGAGWVPQDRYDIAAKELGLND